jgi:hypothetical protein
LRCTEAHVCEVGVSNGESHGRLRQECRADLRRVWEPKYVELSGHDHVLVVGDADAILDEIEEFLTGARLGTEPDRALLTVMFTDIAGSTDRAVDLGDRRWRDLLDSHRIVVRRELAGHRGNEVNSTGGLYLRRSNTSRKEMRSADRIRSSALSCCYLQVKRRAMHCRIIGNSSLAGSIGSMKGLYTGGRYE